MKLEWFREHQSKFFWITAIAVIPGMIIFGSFDPFQQREGAVRGRSAEYFLLDGTRVSVSSEKLIKKRSELYRFGRGMVNGEEALHHMIYVDLAKEVGIQVGEDEMVDVIRRDIMRRTNEEVVTEKLHRSVLENDRMNEKEYEQLNHELAVLRRYYSCMDQAKVPDNALYVIYCKQKQSVRLWYKEIKSKTYEGEVEKPKKEELQKVYDEAKKKEAKDPGSFYTTAKLNADVFYIPAKDVKVEMDPKEDELKRFYERNKAKHWKIKPKKDEKKPQYKPFKDVKEEAKKIFVENELKTEFERYKRIYWKDKKLEDVREEVEKRYKSNRRDRAAREMFTKYKEELDKELSKAESDEDKKKAAAAFAKERKLKYWRTDKHTRQELLDGKDELGASNFQKAWTLFFLAEKGRNPKAEENKAKRRYKLGHAEPYHKLKDDEGYVAYRLVSYDEERLMTLEEATPRIEEQLLQEAAVKKAEEVAKKLRDKWDEGKELPKDSEWIDETFTNGKEPRNALASQFFLKTQPLGEVLPVAEEPDPEFEKDKENRRRRFLVGFAVERKLPTFQDFEQDFEFNVTNYRRGMEYGRRYFMSSTGLEDLVKKAKPVFYGERDAPLFERQQQ